jgi:uncharacterized damage-inducible protein DinB
MLPPIFRGEIADVPLMVSVWLRGLEDIEESLTQWTKELTNEGLWWQPEPELNSIGGLIKHMLGASERLLHYAQGQGVSEAMRATAATELQASDETVSDLLAEAQSSLAGISDALKQFSETDLNTMQAVGQKKVPCKVAFILHHLVEHAQLHMGQIMLIRKLWDKQQALVTLSTISAKPSNLR